MFSISCTSGVNHCNKEQFTAEDEQRRKDWVFTKFPPGGGGGSDEKAQCSGKGRGGGGHRGGDGPLRFRSTSPV